MAETSPAAQPSKASYQGLIVSAQALFDTGLLASEQVAGELRAIVEKVLVSDRGSALDGSDPANDAALVAAGIL